MELKFKFKYIYRGRETDPVGREVKVVKIKNRTTAPSNLEKEIGGQPTKIKIYKSRTAIKRTAKNI